VEISNLFAALDNFDESMYINSVRENIRDNIKTSANENLGYHKLNIINHCLVMSSIYASVQISNTFVFILIFKHMLC
jgi:hypothetical protein